MISSVSRFPAMVSTGYMYLKPQLKFGQIILCVTLEASIKSIISILFIQNSLSLTFEKNNVYFIRTNCALVCISTTIDLLALINQIQFYLSKYIMFFWMHLLKNRLSIQQIRIYMTEERLTWTFGIHQQLMKSSLEQKEM